MVSLHTAVLTAVLSVGAAGVVTGQTPGDTLRLADLISEARGANPAVQAARLRAEAALDRVGPAGALPDPRLGFGLMNRPLDGFGTAQPMTMNQVQLTQTFPWPGQLGNRAAAQRQAATAAGLDADDTELQLIAGVTDAYYRLAATDRAITEMGETRDLLRQFLQVAQTMYGVGRAQQQDVFQAQVAVARMTADITTTQAAREGMAAHLGALLGRPSTAAMGPLELSVPSDSLPDADSLMAVAAAKRPALQAARARLAAAEAAARAARRDLYPRFMLSLAYNQRPRFDDMGTLMVGVSLPLWAGRKQLPLRRAAIAERASRAAEEQNLYNATSAELTARRADAERARSLVRLYQSAILPQARASVEAALSAYRVGKVDYMTLVNDQMTVNRYAIERFQLIAEYHSAVAHLQALIGETNGATP